MEKSVGSLASYTRGRATDYNGPFHPSAAPSALLSLPPPCLPPLSLLLSLSHSLLQHSLHSRRFPTFGSGSQPSLISDREDTSRAIAPRASQLA